MKAILELELLGAPSIFVKGKPIFFSFAKVSALLYYLAINKFSTRDEVAGLLWPNMPDKSAKKNLRNTIYQANKELGAEYILSPNKANLQMNKELLVQSDTDKFLLNPSEHLDLYKDEFLKGFFVKNAEEFNEWVEKSRKFFEQKFIQSSYQKVVNDIQEKRTIGVEKNIRRLIALDEYDERNYQLLMQFYQSTNRNSKVIETYYELSNLLSQDLGIQPNELTQKIYNQTLDLVKQKKKQKEVSKNISFFGRAEEIQTIDINLNDFFLGNTYQSIVVEGEFGVGKSSLCELILKREFEAKKVFKITCFKSEQTFPLNAWQNIVQQMNFIVKEKHLATSSEWENFCEKVSLNPEIMGPLITDKKIDVNSISFFTRLISEVLKKISEHFNIIIFIENFQWIDSWSLSLLTSLMLHQKYCFFLLTVHKNSRNEIQDFLHTIAHYNKASIIELEPFNKREVKQIMQNSLPKKQMITPTLIKQLYNESEGKPLFLTEYINQLKMGSRLNFLTINIKEALDFLLVDVENTEKKILEVMSYFKEGSPLSIIEDILQLTEQEILVKIISLEKKSILIESTSDNKLSFYFVHSKLRQYIYEKQTIAQRRIMHEKIANALAGKLEKNNDRNSLLLLIAEHYEKAEKKLKAIDYELSYLQSILYFQHELFPVFDEYSYPVNNFMSKPMKKSLELGSLQTIEKRLEILESEYSQEEEFHLLLMKFLYLQGRYFINHDNYDRGIASIQQVISKAKEYHNDRYLIRGYRQMVYYSIQTDNALEMEHYNNQAMNVAIKLNDYESVGILLRLQGLQNLMIGKLTEAKRLFQESINALTISIEVKDRYVSNIAAAYDYLAEIERLEENYEKAIYYQKKAIKLCEGTSFTTSLVIFYVNIGVTLFVKQDLSQSEYYLKKADKIYEELTLPWKRVEKDVFLALIKLQRKNEQEVLVILRRVNNYFSHLTNSRDKGIVYFLNAVVKYMLDKGIVNCYQMSSLLEEEQTFYYKKTIENLSPYRDSYELNYLNQMYQNNL
ncbi:BTAD domain-containing putative transcriptional regulator [Tetragenococcus koreensis]|uniref:LuxR family transcriptional regulator n=1 Tax=Tetragenococcus koreensis TaxID=290335 RepID=A0AAN4UBZ9_9ENTE|nr:BTAD domain-containing putative transcriptional regulator [Tetragenococcus koreensis]GEQ49651.1 LuxR family transcriptional regulator [Tetragenococcus koreensis]GEQ52097.1 LuxR family transcriptional regulator [Tetragenococcus koreensis]GEQ54632.1 LuxR family transcriptional regulator [Tetragenococcus koreensis]GEQ57088.1 LuxR family transcriptional regulator [Tetragenococcus koreensis]GEQ59664.1 LuxR family transcriptional regulator [Tetragenococcus koreensis]